MMWAVCALLAVAAGSAFRSAFEVSGYDEVSPYHFFTLGIYFAAAAIYIGRIAP